MNLVGAIRDGLAELADPAAASAMQRYMKSAMPFRGVATPARRQLVRAVLATCTPADRAAWEAAVLELWDGAEYREERYAALDICAHRSARAWQDAATVPMYDHLVVTGAWWDHVDSVASPLLGPILRGDREAVEPTVRRWITDADRWRRRVSIIVQNGSKGATDVDLLADAIVANMADRDFFIRTAVGWALREYAKTDREWVRTFVGARGDALSALSRREAMKHLG